MAMEECAELIQATNKCNRNFTADSKAHLAEEIADVEIMIAQLKIMFDVSEQEISKIRQEKLERLSHRIERRTTNGE